LASGGSAGFAGGDSRLGPSPRAIRESELILPLESMFCADWNFFSPLMEAWFEEPLGRGAARRHRHRGFLCAGNPGSETPVTVAGCALSTPSASRRAL
jgi:hypothetical protein